MRKLIRKIKRFFLVFSFLLIKLLIFGQHVEFADADASMIELKNELMLETSKLFSPEQFCAAFSQDCKMLAYANYEDPNTRTVVLKIMELSTKKIIYKIRIPIIPNVIGWSPDGTKLLMCTNFKLFHYDIKSGKLTDLPVSIGNFGAILWRKDDEVYFFGTTNSVLKLSDLSLKDIEYSKLSETARYASENSLKHHKCKIIATSDIMVSNFDDSYTRLLKGNEFAVGGCRASVDLKYIVYCYFNKIILLNLGLKARSITSFSVRIRSYEVMDKWGKNFIERLQGGLIMGQKINPLNNTIAGGDGNVKGKANVTSLLNDSTINIEIVSERLSIKNGDIFTFNNVWGILEDVKPIALKSVENKSNTESTSTNQATSNNTVSDLKIVNKIDGSWSGDIFQTGVKKPYSIKAIWQAATNQFTISYPAYGCEGVWTVEASSDKSIDFREQIQKGRCTSGGLVRLNYVSQTEFEFLYFKPGATKPNAQGKLTK